MPKQLNVNLAFTADTSAAKRQIQELQNSLTQLVNGTKTSGNKLGITKDINDAIKAAAELKIHLQNAINTNTGNLDFSRLSESLKKSGTDLNVYGQKLRSLGPEGQQAFQQLAKSVAQSEIPLRRSTALLDQFKTTLMNTARWQISSSVLHGFMGALQGAYGYAQDLNESLNNIRIVTGASVEEMSAFAENANKAAQSLSTTTTQYTDAALIYYQQGIRDQEEIAGRVETTIKLANVSRQSAEEVSNEMTAIWNNFYDGSKSLEYYADVITALGAATASSSEEISTGLQKFAAIADTVGLSYEYATSALATITATTRQSAETVGTGLRTLFSRLEGLKLGETLEDGVDLNKYSKALNSVGVQVLDVSGNLRDMDDILDDLGARWGELSKAQQTALAQTVGGVRQYTNLIALMDNWDFMQENLGVASNAEGTLQEQADIYAESWEAAQKRVKAAAQAIYGELLDDKFFIKLTNTLADVIDKIDDVIQALGGLPGVLSLIGSLVTKIFHDQMAEALTSAAYSLKMMTKSGREEVQKERTDFIKNAADAYGNEAGGDYTQEGKTRNATMRQELELQADLTDKASSMSEMELQVNQQLLDRLGILREIAVAKAKELDQAKEALSNASLQARAEAIKAGKNSEDVVNAQGRIRKAVAIDSQLSAIKIPTELDDDKIPAEVDRIKRQLLTSFENVDINILSEDDFSDFNRLGYEIESLDNNLEDALNTVAKFKAMMQGVVDAGVTDLQEAKVTDDTIEQIVDGQYRVQEATRESTEAIEEFTDTSKNLDDSIKGSHGNIKTWADGLVNAANLAMNVAMSISMIKGAIDTIQDPDASPLDKLTSILMALGMVIPSILPSISALIVEEEALGAAGAKAGMGLTISSKGVAMFGGAIKLAFPTVLAIVAAIGALVAIVSVLVDKYNKDAKAAKQAAEAAEKLADAEQEATQTADSLRSSIDKYDSCVEKLNQCTKGTQEWKDALKETGKAAVETLDKVKGFLSADDYKTLLDTYKRTGELDQQILENAQAKADAMAEQVSYAKTIGDYSATEAQINSQQTDLSRSINWAGGNVNDSFIKDNMDKLAEALNADDLKDKLRQLGVNVSNLSDNDLQTWQEQIQAMSESVEQAAGQLNLLSQIEIENLLGDAYSDAAKAYAGSQQSQYTIDAQNEWTAKMKGSGINKFSDQNNEIYQDILQGLQKAGYNLSADSNAVRGTDSNRSFGFRDQEGKEVEFSADYIASILAANEAMENLSVNATEATQTLSKMPVEGQNFVSSLMENFNNNADEFDLSTFAKNFTGEELEALKDASDGELLSAIGLDQSQLDEVAALYGKSGEDILNALSESINNASEKFDTAGEDLIANMFKKPFHELTDDSSLTTEAKEALAENIHAALEQGGPEAVEDLLKSYGDLKAAGGDLNAELTETNDIFNEMAKTFTEALDFNSVTEQVKSLHDIMDKVNEVGDAITAEEFDQLSDEAKEFFAINSEGEYELIGNAKDFKDVIDSTDVDKLKELATGFAGKDNALANAQEMASNGIDLNQASSLTVTEDAKTGGQRWDVDTDQVATQIELMSQYREELGLSEQELTNWIDALLNHNATAEQAQGCLQEMQTYLDSVDLSIDGLTDRAEENAQQWQQVSDAVAMSAKDFDELQEMLEKGEINADSFNRKWEQMQNDLGEGIDMDELEDMADYIGEAADEMEGLSDDLDINNKALKNNAKEMARVKKGTREVAKDIAKFDRAVVNVAENMETWQDQLESGDIQEHSKAIKGLQGAYGDLLDVSGNNLSEAFLTDADNMRDLELAAQGDEEAYNRLAEAARQDMAANIGLNDEEFQAGFQDLMDKYYQGQNLEDLEVGASLDNTQFLDALSKMINAAGMTAEQATDYLSSMGVDAEIETVTEKQPTTKEITGWNTELTPVTKTGSVPVVSGSGENVEVSSRDIEYTVYETSYTPKTETVTDEAENGAFSLKVTSAQKSSGGGFKFNNSTHGGGSQGSGRRTGSCFIAGTLVSTIEGFKLIEDIEPGDVVLSYNEVTKENEYSTVLQTMIHQVDEDIYKIYIGSEKLQVTGIHRFYIKRAGLASWLPASGLRAGDLMYLASGEWQVINQIIRQKEKTTVYNFEVANNHNYYVSNTQILAHNKGSCFVSGTLVSTNEGFKNIEDIRAGDIVLSYNEQSKQNVYSQVVDTMIHFTVENIYTLYIANEILKVTGIHRFFIKRNNQVSWIHAQDLQINDLVLFASGEWVPILNIEKQIRFRKVYNFEVSNTHNYYVGENQILAHNKGRRETSRRRTEPKRVEVKREAYKPREETERYHVVRNQLETIGKELDKIDMAYDRAFGSNKLALLDQQIEKQQELIKKQKEYVKEISKNVTKDRKKLQSTGKKQYWSDAKQELRTVDTSAEGYLGMSVKFDEKGDITNYDELMKANDAAYNKRVDEFNKKDLEYVNEINAAYAAAAAAKDAGDEKAEEAANKKAEKWEKKREALQWIMEEADAQYEGFIEGLEQYEETYDLYLEEQNKYQEELNKYYDQLLEKTKLGVTLKIDVSDDSLKILDFMLERIQEDAYKAAERIALLGSKADESFKKIDAYQEGLAGIFNNHGMEGDKIVAEFMQGGGDPQAVYEQLMSTTNTLTEEEVNTMREYVDGLLTEMTNLAEYRLQVVDEIGVVMDANMETLDRMASKIQHLKTVTNAYKNIVDLTGRSYLRISSEVYDQMEQTNVALSQQSLDTAKKTMEYAQEQLDQTIAAHEAVAGTISEEEEYHWQQLIKQAEDYVQESTENYYSSWEEAIEAVNTRFESSMKNMAEDFSKTMAGVVGNLEGLKEQMDLSKKVRDVYLPEYERIYQLTKLTRDAQKQIDESNNVKVKRELQKVQEKILAAQREGKELSQYDIDYLQKELELKAAQLALEEASQVKSQVRMSRDSEGNYSYVYTANEDAVADAENNYNAKLYEMQKLNEEYIDNLQTSLVDLENDYINALQKAADTYGIGTQEYYDAVKIINEDYNKYFAELSSQMGNALANQQTTANEHARVYREITGDVYQANATLTTSWGDTLLAAKTGYDTLEGYEQAWGQAASDAAAIATKAAQQWEEDTQETYRLAGIDVEKFSDDSAEDLLGVETAMGKISSKAAELDKQLNGENGEGGIFAKISQGFSDTLGAVTTWEQAYSQKIQEAIDKNTELASSINAVIAAASTTTTKKSTSTKDEGGGGSSSTTTTTSTKKSTTTKTTTSTKKDSRKTLSDTTARKIAADIWVWGGSGSGWGDGNTRKKRLNEKFKDGYNKVQGYINSEAASGKLTYKWSWDELKKYHYSKFFTGGYTGNWAGPEGKMAMLHQKELVLNAKDTENMLNIVSMVREISKIIDINAISAGNGFKATSIPNVASANSNIDQNVHITAEFPNATNRNEILAAFDNVINLASQYAHR